MSWFSVKGNIGVRLSILTLSGDPSPYTTATYDADGNLTQSRAYFDSGTSDYYATDYQYDWRDRLTNVLSPAHVVTHYEYDNLDRALWTRTYASADFTLENGELRAETHNLYDSLGRVYESDTYCVTVTSGIGTAGHYLPTYTWYDLAGNVIKTETGTTGAFQKYSYDGLGRLVEQYTGYDTSESTADLYNPTTGVVGQGPFITDEKERRAPRNSGARGEWTIAFRQCHAERR